MEEYQKAIDIQCRLLERQTGFSPGTFSFDLKSGRMTATQVVSDDKETYNTTKAIQENGLRQGLLDLMYAYDIYATLYGLAAGGAFDPSVSFGDSIFEDTGVEFARRRVWWTADTSGRNCWWLVFRRQRTGGPGEVHAGTPPHAEIPGGVRP